MSQLLSLVIPPGNVDTLVAFSRVGNRRWTCSYNMGTLHRVTTQGPGTLSRRGLRASLNVKISTYLTATISVTGCHILFTSQILLASRQRLSFLNCIFLILHTSPSSLFLHFSHSLLTSSHPLLRGVIASLQESTKSNTPS